MKSRLGLWLITASALAALAVWPFSLHDRANESGAASLPTMAPVRADYRERDRLIAFWEGAVGERHRGDMLSPRVLAEQYLQRYRETADIQDVLRAQHAVERSLQAQPVANVPAEVELSSILLTLHRFHDAMSVLRRAMWEDPNDPGLEVRKASLDLEVGSYRDARALLTHLGDAANNDIAIDTVRSRYDELTGNLSHARRLLARARALQNSSFDAPAQQRAWFFFREGELAFEAGASAEAIADEHTALTLFPAYGDAYRALARFECALQAWHECLEAAARAAQITPFPETLGYEVDAQRALGNPEAARATDDLIHTIERIGNAQHISDRLLATYYSEHGERLDDAYQIAKRELATRDDVFTQDTLAWAAAMAGHWNEARRATRQATRYGTQDARLQYHAGVIALHFGDRAEAKRRFLRALALNPHFHPFYAANAAARLRLLNGQV